MNPLDPKKLPEFIEKLKDVVDPSVYSVLQADAARYAQSSPEEIRAESKDLYAMLLRQDLPALPDFIDPTEFLRMKDDMRARLEPLKNRLKEIMPEAFGEP